MDLAFSLLPSLPNLRSLVLNFFAAHFLFGPELALDVFARDEEIGMRVSSLKDLARRVQDLTLIDFRPAQAAKLLGVWPNLRRFRLVHEAPSPKDTTSALPKALRGLKHLHTLELSCHSFVDMMSASAGIELFRHAAPPVTTLRIEALTVEEGQFIFISCFASTLTTLSITLNRCTDATLARLADAALSPAPVDLPLLTSLSLTTVVKKRPSTMARRPLPILSVFLGAFSSAPLLHLHLNDLSESIDVGETSPLTLLATKFPTLRQISIEPRGSGVGVTASEFTHLAAFCAARGLPPPTQTPFEGCFTRGMEDGGGHSAVVCDGMERVLEFGAREIARVRRADNVRETRVLLEVLRPLEEYRRRWLD